MGNNNLHVKDFCTYPFHILVSCSNIFTQCCNIAESRRKKCSFLYFALFLQVLVSCTFVTGHNLFDGVTVTKSDYHALRALKHELIDFKGVLRSWNESGFGACSGSWVGIKCVNGNVIAIQLPFKGLGGKISEKIGQLQSLRKISLHDNLLTGPIPYSLGFLPNLRGLYLFNNKLSGSIPPSIGNCLMLQSLDVSNNLLIGKIPHSLSNFTRIYRINLSFNSLSGSIPSSITMSPSLTILALQYNNLSGSIPSYWGGMGKNKGFGSKLQVLTLDHNLISGTIPVSISKLSLVENISLSHNKIVGSIPSELHALSRLRFLDLSNNDINGSIPKTFSNLASLVSLNLEGNKLENHIPDSLNRLHNLSVLNLKNNKLDGKIPSTIGNIKGITKIDLSKNKLFGEIPHSFAKLAKLSFFNVSYNNLSGPVPYVLTKRFHSSSFTGNLKLCGFIASKPCPSPSPQILPSPTQNRSSKQHHHHKLSTKSILLIAAGIIIIILLVTCCLLLCCLVKKRGDSKGNNGKAKAAASATIIEKGGGGVGGIESSGGEAGGKLVHFDGPFVFTADDLLCATAEIMGKSPYGTAYKATLEDGNQVVVKRLREKSTKGQKEFETEAASLGKIRHQNLLALRAYYLGPKGEKLLVFDYMTKGSLASFLHARGPETVIEWPTRMNIAIGITHGLYHLHKEENIVHGNLTSSNILLDEQTNPHITDFGLSRLMTTSASTNIIATAGNLGYNPPELSKTKKPNQKSDVYSLGVIILELLTGKPPGETSNGMELPQWVASIVKEEWTNEVFDLELMRDATTITDELLNTLKLALHCVDPSPSARPDIQQVLHQLNQIKPQLLAAHDDE
ncbi:PREDICTED: probably inactive leucine-rich repeat receptor-like protein kinase IMK2 isoform X1 [Lupinus angustifolius]|uniref:probably inactive leucine-rich repeat receptor-like protein kinase IMK2 isoform X1 n=1 Tax=Lupinus angustifolius TaxID=3871 RepID=UPI00092E93E7|nr:PREDICTED: probably inactive leucine-rich repeat receptor-like protein kinase IMK2 isoform X1 [Lupinus angustifolius]